MRNGIPSGLGDRGKAMWKQLLVQDASLAEPLNPVRQVATEACRAADLCERLHEELLDAPLVMSLGEREVQNPLLAEIRQQRNILKQLVAALRMPDEQTGAKPQRRGGGRGGYSTSSSPGTVTALDRMRKAAGS